MAYSLKNHDVIKETEELIKDICRIFKINRSKARQLVKNKELLTRSIYSVDENFFDIVDTEGKSYFLGLYFADGCNLEERNRVSISLQERDKDILEELRISLQYTGDLRPVKRQRNTNDQPQWALQITNKHLSKRLSEWGMVQNKTFKLKYPKLFLPVLERHFVRGYFDGDGSIIINKKKRCLFSIAGTKIFCQSIREIFKKWLNIDIHMGRVKRGCHTWKIATCGNQKILKIMRWLYKDATIFMDRKYKTYLELEERVKTIHEPRRCSVEGCNRKHFGKGYCELHYYHKVKKVKPSL